MRGEVLLASFLVVAAQYNDGVLNINISDVQSFKVNKLHRECVTLFELNTLITLVSRSLVIVKTTYVDGEIL